MRFARDPTVMGVISMTTLGGFAFLALGPISGLAIAAAAFFAARFVLKTEPSLAPSNSRTFSDSNQIGPAALLTPSWRGNPFLVGQRYRVLASPPPPSSRELSPGDSVTYQGSGYSRYDGASIHYFLTDTGEPREWWLFDDHPIEQSRTLFAPEV